MNKWCNNRLTVLGAKEQVQRFLSSKWDRRLGARYGEWIENFPRRVVCLFETDEPPLASLRRLSRRHPQLILLLDWEVERERIKGLVKAQAGSITHCQFEYCGLAHDLARAGPLSGYS
jgi:hypothetical protein